MGSEQSSSSSSSPSDQKQEDPSSPPLSPFESLTAEATAAGNVDDEENLELKAQRALECPCVADLRDGPCGKSFSEAFVCYIKSTSEEKGSDCVHQFLAMKTCIESHPDAFLEYDETKKTDDEGKNQESDELPNNNLYGL
eukprot:c21685_g1_i1 orf=763-1182(-)